MLVSWNLDKNNFLKINRNISFEEVEDAIANGDLLDILPHYNLKKYPNQKIFVVRIRQYIYYVPFVENEKEIFLKTIIPSRKYEKKYNKK